jgi:hypothetical protein
LRKARTRVAARAAAKVRQMSRADKCDEVSSSANSTPPTGAPSAAAIPAPLPTQMKSRRSLSVARAGPLALAAGTL